VKKILFALAGLAVAAVSLAQLTKYKDWDKSPEAYFLTSTERADWKKVATDQDAEQFIALYWAKRGGEAFKQEIARRIGAADQQFKLARYHRGADSVRGRILVVMGPPSRVSQQRARTTRRMTRAASPLRRSTRSSRRRDRPSSTRGSTTRPASIPRSGSTS